MLAMRLCHLVSLSLLQIGSVMSDFATHVYLPECAPPDGAVPTPSPVGTPGPTTSASPFPYFGVLPIEYCCPQMPTCKKWGGFCALKWLLNAVLPDCDYYEDEVCRDYGCSCCIKCSRDKCSKCTQSGGNCRAKCKSDEIRDHFKKCDYFYCNCCKKCEMLDECAAANGTCRANHYDCPPGTAASTGCCGGCACCKPELQKDFACEHKTGSYCSLTEEGCVEGYYACFGECEATQFYNGLESPLVGYCCAPKNSPVSGAERIGEFDYDMDEEAIEDIEFEKLNNLAPRPVGGDRAQANVEELAEDQIYNEVVSEKKHEEPAVNPKLSNVEEVVEKQMNEEANLKEENNLDVEFASLIQDDSDSNAVIDTPMDISDQVFDNPIDISEQVLDTPIDYDMMEPVKEVDENNEEVEKPKHHRRHKKN